MKKIEENELIELQNIQKLLQDLSFKFGEIELSYLSLKSNKEILIKEFNNIQQKEKELKHNLISKYGEDITINIKNGNIE